MKFYVLQDKYIRHLQAVDERVPDNERGDRTYVGVVFEIGNFKYFAPMTSPKPTLAHITASDLRFFNIHQKGNPQNDLGKLRLSSMLPVAEGAYQLLDVKAQTKGYQTLLVNQIMFIVSMQDEIKSKAKLLYEVVISGKNKDLVDSCCKFIALEKACVEYAQANPPPKQEFVENERRIIHRSPQISAKPKSLLTLRKKSAGDVSPDPAKPASKGDGS